MSQARVGLASLLVSVGCASPSSPQPPVELALERERQALSRRHGQGSYSYHRQFAERILDLLEHPETPSAEKSELAARVLESAEAAIVIDEQRAAGHYLRALAVGRCLEYAALPNPARLAEMERSGQRARALDPSFKAGSPARLLALLYQRSPAWPVGPEWAGEDEVIEELFLEALRLGPDDCENQLCYAEFLLELAREEEAMQRAELALQLLPSEARPSWAQRALRARIQRILVGP